MSSTTWRAFWDTLAIMLEESAETGNLSGLLLPLGGAAATAAMTCSAVRAAEQIGGSILQNTATIAQEAMRPQAEAVWLRGEQFRLEATRLQAENLRLRKELEDIVKSNSPR
jgi:hypothetical protein